jgi:outer membrane immunogenic protein
MRSKFVTLLVAAFSLGVVQAASAADMPVRAPVYKAPAMAAPYNWAGLYVGGNVGLASVRNCYVYQSASNFNFDDGCQTKSGFIGGGQIGFNWQTGNWVFGLEGSGDWASIKASAPGQFFTGDLISSKANSIFLATARAGYAWDRSLLYVKGGAAFVHSSYERGIVPAGPAFATGSETRAGWTVGAGWEYGFAPNWSAALEYDYIGGGTKSVTLNYNGPCFGGAPCNQDVKQSIHMVTLRVNYRFNWMH